MSDTAVYHDPIGRYEIIRHLLPPGYTCSECGQPARFIYGTEPDDRMTGRVDWTAGKFCGIDCWRAYS